MTSNDKARHDKLVMLVENMLALTPKLRAAKTDSEKATLQNAVNKTDPRRALRRLRPPESIATIPKPKPNSQFAFSMKAGYRASLRTFS